MEKQLNENSMDRQNPLLRQQELPPFGRIQITHLEPAIRTVIQRNENALEKLLAMQESDQSPDWKNFLRQLEELEDQLSNVWSVATHLYLVRNTDEMRKVYDQCQPLVIEYNTRLAQNVNLYERMQRLANSNYYNQTLSSTQRKVVDDYLLDFRLAGVDLESGKQLRFKELEQAISKLANRFSNNVLDSTRAWSRHFNDVNALRGLPQLALESAASAARLKGMEGFLLTLDYPSFSAAITYAEDEQLRRDIYHAYFTRASDQDELFRQWDNQQVIREILQLRREIARLLGFENYASLSLAKKMADTPQEVIAFLNRLANSGLPFARKEMQALREFARSEGKAELHAWDISFYSEKQRKKLFDISQEEIRIYFPLHKVESGLFDIVARLFGVEIRENDSYETWDSQVKAYDVSRDGKLMARFFFDLFTREGKQSGAWMDVCRSRRVSGTGEVQLPAAYLICNFTPATDTSPALLTHAEVTTLFHEFGHGLHHILTLEKDLRVSGLNGVAWDAVELPSQLMENWCWDPESIKILSAHYQTGEQLPEAMLKKMLSARNFQAGMKMMRQLEFAMFDFQLHMSLENLDKNHVRQILENARHQTSVFAVPEFNRSENTFSHIFAGGYAAGYYSYYWAEVLSADVFSRFEETGVMNPQTGQNFLEKLLGRGGSKKALELFVDFMGRQPQVEALLKQKGMTV